MDLSGIPAIDVHAHPFRSETAILSENALRDAISVSLRGETSRVNESMLLSRFVIHHLARLLDCDPSWDAVIAARNAASRDNYCDYIARLFGDANIDTLLVDHGYPPDPEVEFEQFAALLPRRPLQGYRIERFFPADGSFHHGTDWRSLDDMIAAFEARLDAAVLTEGHRFFKSVMAYRTGLAIEQVDHATAVEAWNAHTIYGDASDKKIRDYLFLVTVQKAREHNVPFQLHTGHTSHVNVWPNTNPILLTPVLNSRHLDGMTLVLVHGGYPYCAEGGYLTSVYHNVYLDLSLMIPWASAGIPRRISETLESAPIAKIMYGSDGIACPEMHWISAHLARQCLSKVLEELVSDHFLTPGQAEDAANDILRGTAQQLYGLRDAV